MRELQDTRRPHRRRRPRHLGARWAVTALALLAGGGTASAQPAEHCDFGSGGLHGVEDGSVRLEFPLKHTRVDAEVSGLVSRVVVTQTFTNPYTDTIEAVYTFPLPHEAAVTDLTIRLGDREIRGTIERREEARRLYEDARNAGHVAALLEQERPNIFTQSVANILPGNDVEVSLEYVETLPWTKGTCEFVFPMVVGPRYIPGGPAPDALPAGGFPPGASPSDDASRISPRYLPPSVRSGHDIEVSLDWDAGLPIAEIKSPTHLIDVTRPSPRRGHVELHANDTIPNKDLVVRVRSAGDGPGAGVLAGHDGEAGYVTLLLEPGATLAPAKITPKEMIFVVDCSGSMSGEPIAAAKQLVRYALRNVNPGDSFQIIRFSSASSQLASVPLSATPENVRRGIAYIDRLAGGGGTQMIEGVKAALDFPADPGRLRLVMFLTDGYIGNENEILAAVRQRIGSARLFSFGVGSSVNRFLLDELAAQGRGAVQYVLLGSSIEREVSRFYGRIRNPYVTDIEVRWDGVAVDDVEPRRIPDLFDGEPLQIHARYHGSGHGAVEVRGRLGGREWHRRVALELPTERGGPPAIGRLWARARIAGLEHEMRGGDDPERLEEMTRLALAHRLVTRTTSFVAVEDRLVVSNGEPRRVRVPLPMPEGVSYEGVFGNSKGEGAQKLRGLGLLSAGPRVVVEHDAATPPVPAPGEDRAQRVSRWPASVEGAPTVRATHLALALDHDRIRVGEEVVLRITVTNRGRYPIGVPRKLELDSLRLRVIDAKWRETKLGRGKRGGATQELAPGASATFTVRLRPRDAAFLGAPGTYHLVLEGAVFGADDAERVTLVVEAVP